MILKYIYNYSDFLNEKNNINEGLLGKLFNFLKDKTMEYAKKVKASKNIDPLFDEAKETVDGFFKDKTLVQDYVKSKKKSQIQGQGQEEIQGQKEIQGQENLQTEDIDYLPGKSKTEKDNSYQTKLDKAITDVINNLKKKVEIHTKDSKGKEIYTAKMYAQLKFADLEDNRIKNMMELSKKEHLDTEELEKLTKEVAAKSKKLAKEMDNKLKEAEESKTTEYEVGQILNYKNSKGEEYRVIVVQIEPELLTKRISVKDEMDEVQSKKLKKMDGIEPNRDRLKTIEDNYEEVQKNFQGKVKSAKK